MSTKFAERIIDWMVDENGHCGERGLSEKQFDCIARHLERMESTERGGYGRYWFTSTDYVGIIGEYAVKLNNYSHFNERYTVVSIDKWTDELHESQHMFSAKDKVDLELLVASKIYVDTAYGVSRVYRFLDKEGNEYSWRTQKDLYTDVCDDYGFQQDPVKAGSLIRIKGVVKGHWTGRDGSKSTTLTRCKLVDVIDQLIA